MEQIQLPESPLTRANYFDYNEHEGQPVVSSSALKYLYPGEGGSIKKFELYMAGKLGKREAPHQRMGSIFHKYAEDKTHFEVSPEVMPEEGVAKIVKATFDSLAPTSKTKNVEFPSTLIYQMARLVGYQSRWGEEAITRKLLEGKGYWEFLVKADGKHMLTASQVEKLDGMTLSINSVPHLYEQLYKQGALHEVPILWKNREYGIWCKALIDWVSFRQAFGEGTKVVRFLDFKTTSKPVGVFEKGERADFNYVTGQVETFSYPGSLYNYRYYRQSAFYHQAISELLIQMNMKYVVVDANIIAIETVAPYESAYVSVRDSAMAVGRIEVNDSLAVLYNSIQKKKKF